MSSGLLRCGGCMLSAFSPEIPLFNLKRKEGKKMNELKKIIGCRTKIEK
jgi:hypothetical protein